MSGRKNFIWILKGKWFFLFLFLIACVDRINFEVPPAKSQIVVEGMISDGPGPYSVKVSEALNLNLDSLVRVPVENVKVTLYDDEGNTENLTETEPGVYLTGGLIKGKVGHAYHIQLETVDGKMFKSEPDSLKPVGEIQNIRYEYEARTTEKSFGVAEADVFNILLDSYAGTLNENYVRWRFTGIYKVHSNPELHTTFLQVSAYMTPLPCSGYIVVPSLGGGKLEKVGECFCCTCWVTQNEEKPQLSDVQLITNNQFKNIKIAEVPITIATFYEKYMVQVEQMSLTRKSYEFFKLIRTQKEGASSLFQPPSGEIRGNVRPTNPDDAVVGLFWATSISSKSLYIDKKEVPYLLAPIYSVQDACTNYYPNATTTQPKFWE